MMFRMKKKVIIMEMKRQFIFNNNFNFIVNNLYLFLKKSIICIYKTLEKLKKIYYNNFIDCFI